MRDRRDFIQAAVVAWMPFLEWDPQKALRYAERAWTVLSEQGHGARTPETPRASVDWCAKLPPDQAALFGEFWIAFARKGDSKNRAAMVWHQLAPSPTLARSIIAAAAQEAAQPRRPDEVRKMAQGWLSERRWESYTPPQVAPQDTRAARLRELRGELTTLRRLDAGGGTFAAQILALESEIAALCPATSTPPPTT